MFHKSEGVLGSRGLWHGLAGHRRTGSKTFFLWFSRKRDEKREILEEVPRVSVRGFSLFRDFLFLYRVACIYEWKESDHSFFPTGVPLFITGSDEWMVEAVWVFVIREVFGDR